MKDINGNDIKVGTKVKLVNADPGYSIGRNNPLAGTKWECAGKYVGGGTVEWDNGTQNGYKGGELVPAEPYIDLWYNI